jgi:hypothetical protein
MSEEKENFSDRWNNLSFEQRKFLMPYEIQTQILHYEQIKQKAIKHHNDFIRDVNSHINNLRKNLLKEKQ